MVVRRSWFDFLLILRDKFIFVSVTVSLSIQNWLHRKFVFDAEENNNDNITTKLNRFDGCRLAAPKLGDLIIMIHKMCIAIHLDSIQLWLSLSIFDECVNGASKNQHRVSGYCERQHDILEMKIFLSIITHKIKLGICTIINTNPKEFRCGCAFDTDS